LRDYRKALIVRNQRAGGVIIVGMRTTIAVASLLLAAFARADEVSDRADIERTIGALNKAQSESEWKDLFTADGIREFDRLPALDRGPWSEDPRPWSEVSNPGFVVRAVRFVNPETALVDATSSQFGSTIVVRRTPVLFVMQKEKSVWKIASVRLLANPLNFQLTGAGTP
jgi:hypothetical protein